MFKSMPRGIAGGTQHDINAVTELEVKETAEPLRKKEKATKNSDIYTKEDRPPMFENNEAFDILSADKAAEIVLQYYAIREK